MREQAFQIVKTAIEELNEELDYESLRDVNEDTAVFGGDEGIDSLSLVRLVVCLEQAASEAFSTPVVLSDERAMSAKRSPYRTAATITDLIMDKLSTVDA